MTLASDFLLDIAHEKNGYTLGEPWRFSEFSLAAIIPILREADADRRYKLASEVKDQVIMKDTGNIDKMEITNKSNSPVLVKAGEVIKGATQSRTLVVSQVIMPGEQLLADCACVHSTFGIRAGQQVKSSGYSPSRVRRTIGAAYASRPVGSGRRYASFGYSSRLQQEVWRDVKEHSSDLGDASARLCMAAQMSETPIPDGEDLASVTPSWRTAADDLAGRIKESEEKFKAVLKNIPHLPNQVGLVLLTVDGLDSLESFEHKDSWTALREAFLQAEAGKVGDVSDQNGVFEFRADKARSIIQGLLDAAFEESVTVEKTDTSSFLLESEKLRGEVVSLFGVPIHCAFVKKV